MSDGHVMPRREQAIWWLMAAGSFGAAVILVPTAGEWVLAFWAVLVLMVGALLIVLHQP